ncbi:MAG: nucleotidyltransferase family protein [Dolichospermum sp. DET50]|jgi:predicted nucleotidyltransferase|nr:nucleotidyltransferase family protein [Dolichospermum sp. DET66]MBS3034310.1 nucleotidyltransferase family protein [Dolichospermum sp. DET67]MBS3039513.1 nucleotidyltransferase family protein [Dolichospermum sp. DET50]QSX66730.1 MAG: nucleotidyltransferase family protein [Dolichospermum sp. DET69]
MNREEVLQILRTHQQELKDLGVRSLELFGSVARNEARPDSDVDCLAEFSRPFGLIQFSKVQRYLEEILDCSVDLGTKNMLKENIRDCILAEVIYVF